MAITTEDGILAMLKVYYKKNGLENLLFRNSPVLKMLSKDRVVGKSQNFSALYTRGGAVAASYLQAKAKAQNTAQAKEFQVTPGQLFACCVYNNKELLASKNAEGAYMPIAAAKLFATTESFRKTLATALYHNGYGTLFQYGASATDEIDSSATSSVLTFPKYAIMGIDIGSELDIRAAEDNATSTIKVTVTKIEGDQVTVSYTAPAADIPLASLYVCLSGCIGASNEPLLPIGLGGWIPASVSANENFFGVDRSVARDRLAGAYIGTPTATTIHGKIEELILQLRRQGSLADMIIMNDEDYMALGAEIDSKTYFPRYGKAAGEAENTFGHKGYGFAVSTNWLDNVIDDPYCPKGMVYVLSSDTINLWSYTNTSMINDGVAGNDAGKPDVGADTGSTVDKPFQLMVDDMFSITPGVETVDGPGALIAMTFYGQFAITNPSVNGAVNIA